MIIKIIVFNFLLFNSLTVFSYDGVIKNKYGKVTGYIDKKSDKTYMINKYGKSGDYIEHDGTIKDKYGCSFRENCKIKNKIPA